MAVHIGAHQAPPAVGTGADRPAIADEITSAADLRARHAQVAAGGLAVRISELASELATRAECAAADHAAATSALRRYGRHLTGCGGDDECTCGYIDVLHSLARRFPH